MNRRIKKKRSKLVSGSYKNTRMVKKMEKTITNYTKTHSYSFDDKNISQIPLGVAKCEIYEIEINKE